MRILILCFTLCGLILFPVPSKSAMPLMSRGESFSDPHEFVKMGDEWQRQLVVHPTDTKTDILINLDQSTLPVLANIIERYASENDLNIYVNSGTCGISNRGLLKKELDMASFCCPPGKEDRLPGVIFHTLGISALEIIVNPANLLENITFAQAQKIFSGDIGRWTELSSSSFIFDYPVQPIAFIHCKKRPGHWRLLLDNEDLFSPRLQNVITIPDIISAVANNKMAVSLSLSYLAHTVNRGRGDVRGLKINNVRADDLDALRMGRYPLYRVTSIAYWKNGSNLDEIQKLLAFLDRYLEKNGAEFLFVPASRLRQSGWKFKGEELIKAPFNL